MKKRSAYRPKWVNPTAHLMAMMGTCGLSTTDALKRALALRLQVEEACGGRATEADWRGILDASDMAEELTRMRVRAAVEGVESPKLLIKAVTQRQRATGSKALYPHEKDTLRDFAADYAGLLSGMTQQQYVMAQRGVEDRVRRVLSGEQIGVSARIVEAA